VGDLWDEVKEATFLVAARLLRLDERFEKTLLIPSYLMEFLLEVNSWVLHKDGFAFICF
jgi:hypothetical protein